MPAEASRCEKALATVINSTGVSPLRSVCPFDMLLQMLLFNI